MFRIHTRSCWINVLVIIFAVAANAADDFPVQTAVRRNVTVFLAEIVSARPSEGCATFRRGHIPSTCDTNVSVRILRIFRGAAETPDPPEFETQINQLRPQGGGATPWGDAEVQAGQRYLILSGIEDLREAFRKTFVPVLVTDDEDAIADLELILNSEHLTLYEQASAVAAALGNLAKTRSYFLTDYVVDLLAVGSDADTADLAQKIEQSPDGAFSNMAKIVLLGHSWDLAKNSKRPAANLLRVYVTMTARYLLINSGKPDDPLIPELRDLIFTQHLPWILRSERATTVLKTLLPQDLRERVARRAAGLALDDRLPKGRREQMQNLLRVVAQ